jgi:hypothetical protein
MRAMPKVIAFVGLVAAFPVLPVAAFAQQGASSSYGTVGWGPVISTQALTPKDRAWNHNNQALYQSGDSAEWLRQHRKGLFPFFR